MNHKRKRPKHQRAGCLMCKPWKASGHHPLAADSEKHSDHVRRVAAQQELRQ
jgi:hypothetical protein